jgi:hypothetical protein
MMKGKSFPKYAIPPMMAYFGINGRKWQLITLNCG